VSIIIALHHVSDYRYDRPVQLGPQLVRLRPAPHCRTRILSYSLGITPEEHFVNWQQDPQANHLARLVFPEKTTHFRVTVDLTAELSVINPFDFFLAPEAEQWPFTPSEDEALERELAPYRRVNALTPSLTHYLDAIPKTKRPTIDFLVDINQRLFNDIAYTIRLEPGVQTPDETLSKRSGSCRDTAWLMVQLMRHLGVAARFVSGYLIQLTPDVKSVDGPNGPEVDFTDLHAWCEVYLPGAGWVGLDPTSGLFAGEGHLPLAASPEPTSAAPISGVVDEAECEFSHEMSVTRLDEQPRVTQPLTDAQREAMIALGTRIDVDLKKQDVRLTMGGEPTFVAADDPDGAEWNTDALGPTKRARAIELYKRMADQYAKGGLQHFGQGKWYPGEQLPRWSLNCFWRRDGKPLWKNSALFADEQTPGNATSADAESFLKKLSLALHLPQGSLFPTYEDTLYYLWRERSLPSNVLPSDPRLKDPMERARMARIFAEEGLGEVVGYALPLARSHNGKRWQTGQWFLRDETCYLLPGDSPMGYRLPLESLPWVKSSDFPYLHAQDPQQSYPALSLTSSLCSPRMTRADERDAEAEMHAAKPSLNASADGIVRTSLCAQVRDGHLYLFLPPLAELPAFIELMAAIEATAKILKQPVILEGYEPPKDPRLERFSVTPDPGVIEVNIHPATSWAETVERTQFLYQAAHECHLSPEKFMVDGRHTGTGGGNHTVLGGATPVDSPFLRRPDLLRSLVSFWHNHPSLSYLFSGLFIGPTSQAPRIDEARQDALYELETAFAQFPPAGESCPPWLVDRLLRHLLVDATGNTHRAEFCIDKLYSPDSSTGRLGLLELRGFDMPPHVDMSLAQQVLLRALVAHFWQTPYAPERLARWGTTLHDRFMLRHEVEQDFHDVLSILKDAGYAVSPDWYRAQFNFRFPHYGDLDIKGMHMELNQALEPWHVLGEEAGAGGTVRYVDSSVERVEVKVSGMAPDRYTVTCNGVALPLRQTDVAGEYIAAVRYRAWQPSNCLHPTIGVHAPLTFDIIDTWHDRALGGCQYHVMHPGGRSYEGAPINAYEAEGRRLARFMRHGHSGGKVSITTLPPRREHPFMVDLRHVRPT